MRCLIVDDSATFRDAACSTLAGSAVDVVATAGSAAEALEQVRRLRPDVVLVDIDLGPENGFDVAAAIHREVSPQPVVIMISTHDQDDFADLTAASSALGFLPKIELSGTAIEALISGIPDT